LQNFKLKSIEKYIGINREDTLSGKDCISLYYSYINKRQKEKRKLILKHNYDDLYYLPFILKALDIIDENKTIRILHSPFEDEINIKIENISFINDMMKLYCKTDPLKIDSYIDYGSFYNLDWNTDEGILNMEFQVKEGLLSSREKSFYLDLKGYENKIDVIDSTSFNLPSNIILLKIGNSLVLDNIKNIVRSTIKNIIK
ncbi:ribonuclease H-like domain-containing protein, partial [Anaerosalibacter bizertensis]|nr:ribonuclease H-like domain-containing protein [Anaerosalibacter bizertensis]